MSMNIVRELPHPNEIKEEYPLSAELAAIKAKRDEEIKAVFRGDSDKFLLIIGPCSADNEDSVLDYILRLRITGKSQGQDPYDTKDLYR